MEPYRLLAHGDSFLGPLTLLHANIVKIGGKHRGASARGLSNPASALQIGPKVLQHLAEHRPSNLFLFFGNVDLQVHFLYQAATKGEEARSATVWANYVWEAYSAWLKQNVLPLLYHGGIEHLFLGAVLHPTVQDVHLSASFTSYTGLEPPTPPLPSFENRTASCTAFNSLLQEFCASHSAVHYVDINPLLLDPETGLIHPRHIDPNYLDIHPMWETTLPFWIEALRDSATEDDGVKPVLDLSIKHVRVDLKNKEATYRKRGKKRA